MKKVVPKVKRILNMSLKQAKLYEDWEVKIEHIMIALINDYNNNAVKILEEMDIDIDMLHKKIEKSLVKNKKEDDMYDIHDDTIPLNSTSQNIIKGAEKECDILKEDYLDTQHILLSLLKTKNTVSGILKIMKVTYKGYNSQVKKHIIENSIDSPETNDGEPFKSYKKQSKPNSKSNSTPILDNFSVDITKMAMDGRVDPVIGRDKTIQRVAQILARKKKNNPVIIGDPGVGKTTIVEGLALKIVMGEAPRTLLDKRIISLDLASLVAGTKYRGQFEERIKGIVD